jgi:predicted DNA-binding ribbon-helix-helix protein
MMYLMRTTIDLPDRLHAQITELARGRGMSLSATVAALAAKGLAATPHASALYRDPVTGLLGVDLGRPITPAEVSRLTEEES